MAPAAAKLYWELKERYREKDKETLSWRSWQVQSVHPSISALLWLWPNGTSRSQVHSNGGVKVEEEVFNLFFWVPGWFCEKQVSIFYHYFWPPKTYSALVALKWRRRCLTGAVTPYLNTGCETKWWENFKLDILTSAKATFSPTKRQRTKRLLVAFLSVAFEQGNPTCASKQFVAWRRLWPNHTRGEGV